MKQNLQKVGIKDVAKRAGVSLSSVSRVLDNHPDVSEIMRNRVTDAVTALGYEPDPVAQSMRTGTTKTVGFVAGDTSNPLISQISLAAEVQLRVWGYSMLVANSSNDPAQESINIKLLQNRKVDGLLLSVADESDLAIRDLLAKSPTKVVLIDREIRGQDFSAVCSDHARGIMEASEHLLNLGHKHVALINGNPRVRPSRERSTALRKAFRKHPDTLVTVVNGSFSEGHGYETTMALLQRRERPTAIIAGSNQVLIGVVRAIRALGLSIPEQISLITCDQTPLAELYQPRIATIRRDAAELGTVAAELLRDLISGNEPEQRYLLTGYEPGESCARPMESNVR